MKDLNFLHNVNNLEQSGQTSKLQSYLLHRIIITIVYLLLVL